MARKKKADKARLFAMLESKRVHVSGLEYDPDNRVATDKAVEELRKSIEANGLLNPPVVRPGLEGNTYQVVAGERRVRAVSELGWTTVEVRFATFDDKEAAIVQGIENAARGELTLLDRANGIDCIMRRGGSVAEAAEAYNCSVPQASNFRALLNLPAKWQKRVANEEIAQTVARELARLPSQILAHMEQDWGRDKEFYLSRGMWEQEVQAAAFNDVRVLDDTPDAYFDWRIKANGGRFACLLTEEEIEQHRKALDPFKLKRSIDGNRVEQLVTVNREAFDELHDPKVAALVAETRREEADGRQQAVQGTIADEAEAELDRMAKEAGVDRSEVENNRAAVEEKIRANKQSAQLKSKLPDWLLMAYRVALAETVEMGDWRIWPFVLTQLATTRHTEFDAFGALMFGAIGEACRESGFNFLGREEFPAAFALGFEAEGDPLNDLERVAYRFTRLTLAPRTLREEFPFALEYDEEKLPNMTEETVLGMCAAMEVNLATFWWEAARTTETGGECLAQFLKLHSREQLTALAKTIAPGLELSASKAKAIRELVEHHQTTDEGLKVPRALATLDRQKRKAFEQLLTSRGRKLSKAQEAALAKASAAEEEAEADE